MQGWRPVTHPHSQHLAFRGAVPLRMAFRTTEALLLEYCAHHLGIWFWSALAVSVPLCGVSTSNRGSNSCFPVLFFPVTDTNICPFIKKIKLTENPSPSHDKSGKFGFSPLLLGRKLGLDPFPSVLVECGQGESLSLLPLAHVPGSQGQCPQGLGTCDRTSDFGGSSFSHL